jgi:flagellar secretion chaperone FliS
MQMNVRAGHAAYQQGQVSSADPVRIVVLLYEGAIRFIAQAQLRWQEPAARGTALGRAHRIISELLASLDHERGGEIATNLDRLYQYSLEAITRANLEADARPLDGVVKVLKELLEGWQSIEEQARRERIAAP